MDMSSDEMRSELHRWLNEVGGSHKWNQVLNYWKTVAESGTRNADKLFNKGVRNSIMEQTAAMVQRVMQIQTAESLGL